jgi:exopolyphosphatase/pppGpp-phosphohydrolase
MTKRYGVIEVGTRGIRLLIADASSAGIERFIYSTGDLSELGREADSEGNLSESSVERVRQLVAKYVEIAQDRRAEEIVVIATEVIRAAPNKQALQDILAPMVQLRVLTREEEAAYSFIACVDAFQHKLTADSTLLGIDQGGGSTELTAGTVGGNGEAVLRDIAILELGTVTLSRMFVNAPNLKKGFDNVRQRVREELAGQPLFRSLATDAPTLTVGLGSAITTFARGIIRERTGRAPSLRDLHGQSVRTTLMAQKITEIEPVLGQTRKEDFGAELQTDSELAILVSGILTYYEILNLYDIQEIYVSRNGMRYGALLWQAGKQCRIELE